MRLFLCTLLLAAAGAAQQPDVATQRTAMKKLAFLVGKWSGDSSVARGPSDTLKLTQAEDVQFKLDALVLLIEGSSRNAEGKTVYRALATVSFDDATGQYHIRAYNDGRYLDTPLTVTSNGFEWGYTAGPVKVSNKMTLTERGEWHETTDVTPGQGQTHRSVEMTLHKM